MPRKKKVCSRCLNDMVLATNYNRDIRTRDGYRSECKLCQYESQLKHLSKKVKRMKEDRDGEH